MGLVNWPVRSSSSSSSSSSIGLLLYSSQVRVSNRKNFQTGWPGREEMVRAVHHVHCVKFHAGIQAPTTYLRQNFGVQDVSLVCEIFSVTSDEKLQDSMRACVHFISCRSLTFVHLHRHLCIFITKEPERHPDVTSAMTAFRSSANVLPPVLVFAAAPYAQMSKMRQSVVVVMNRYGRFKDTLTFLFICTNIDIDLARLIGIVSHSLRVR